MPVTLERLAEALKNADRAGDAVGAKKLADTIRSMRGAAPAAAPVGRPAAPAQGGANIDFEGRFNPPAATASTAVNKGDLGAAPVAQDQSQTPGSWLDVAKQAGSNLGPSAARFGGDIANMVQHPIDTLGNIGNLAMGVGEKAIPGEQQHEVYANALGKFFADRYGGVDNIKRTIADDPVGFASDIAAVLTGGELATIRAAGTVGKIGRIAGTAARAIDPVTNTVRVAKTIGRGVGGVAANILGTTTGAGSTAIRTAAKAGYEGGAAAKAFTENMRGAVPMESVVNDAKTALGAIRSERQAAYKSGMADLGNDQTVLDFNKIDRALNSTNPVKSFKGISLEPSAAETTKEIATVLDQWRRLPPKDFHTAEGFDALKQRIGDIQKSAKPGSASQAIATQVYNVVKGQIVSQAPEYAKTMRGYQEASDLIREIEGTLSLNRNARVDTQLRKLQSVMRNNVNTNYGKRADLVKLLEASGAKNLLAKLAGQSLNSLEPRGLARVAATVEGVGGLAAALVHPAVAAPVVAGLAASSPRLVGEATFAGGRTLNSLGRIPVRQASRGLAQLRSADQEKSRP